MRFTKVLISFGHFYLDLMNLMRPLIWVNLGRSYANESYYLNKLEGKTCIYFYEVPYKLHFYGHMLPIFTFL